MIGWSFGWLTEQAQQRRTMTLAAVWVALITRPMRTTRTCHHRPRTHRCLRPGQLSATWNNIWIVNFWKNNNFIIKESLVRIKTNNGNYVIRWLFSSFIRIFRLEILIEGSNSALINVQNVSERLLYLVLYTDTNFHVLGKRWSSTIRVIVWRKPSLSVENPLGLSSREHRLERIS